MWVGGGKTIMEYFWEILAATIGEICGIIIGAVIVFGILWYLYKKLRKKRED